MGKVKIPYYVVRNGNGFWQAKPHMRAEGFESIACGADGPEAWERAQRANEAWKRHQRGEDVTREKRYPQRSVGDAWNRFRRTQEWASRAHATRAEWEYAWEWIAPVFGDVAPATVEMEALSRLRAAVERKVSAHAAWRVVKVWRAFWKVMAAMKLCDREADPSLAIRNRAPKGRSATWSEGETVRLAKHAWRTGYHGLAALVAVTWDTQFQPGDTRALTAAQRLRDEAGRTFFETSRGKTTKRVIGTLSRRSEALLDAYLAKLGVELLDDARIFRTRSGTPYTKDKLGQDFRTLRDDLFPGDTRKLMDMRRSGAVEAQAGEVQAETLSAKMGNSIAQSQKLQDTYLPGRVATVRLADEARKRGRERLRKNKS